MEHKWYYMEVKWSGGYNTTFTRQCGSLSETSRQEEHDKMMKWFKNNPKLKLISVEFHNGIMTTTN